MEIGNNNTEKVPVFSAKYDESAVIYFAGADTYAAGTLMAQVLAEFDEAAAAGTNTGDADFVNGQQSVGKDVKVGVYTITARANEALNADEFQGDVILEKPVLAIGSTPQNVAYREIEYMINGDQYSLAALAAGKALAAATTPQNKFAAFRFQVGADGTVDIAVAPANGTTGYDSGALALAALPALAADHAAMGTFTVTSTDAGGFVAGTTSLADGAVTVVFADAETAFELAAVEPDYLEVAAPDGTLLERAAIGSAYSSDQINFRINAGVTPNVAGDYWTFTVIDGTFQYRPYSASGVGGLSKIAGVLTVAKTKAAIGTLAGAVLIGGEVSKNSLVIHGGGSITADIINQLANTKIGIIVRAGTVLDELDNQ